MSEPPFSPEAMPSRRSSSPEKKTTSSPPSLVPSPAVPIHPRKPFFRSPEKKTVSSPVHFPAGSVRSRKLFFPQPVAAAKGRSS